MGLVQQSHCPAVGRETALAGFLRSLHSLEPGRDSIIRPLGNSLKGPPVTNLIFMNYFVNTNQVKSVRTSIS